MGYLTNNLFYYIINNNMDSINVDNTNVDSIDVDYTNMDPNIDYTNMDPNIDYTNMDTTNMDPTNMDYTNMDPTSMDPTNIDYTNMEGGVVKKYKFNKNECSEWKKNDVKNPKTNRSIRPQSKVGVYVQLLKQCENVSAAKKRSPSKEPAAAKKRSPSKEPVAAKKRSPSKEPAAAKKRSPSKEPAAAKKRSPSKEPVAAKKRSPSKEPAAAKKRSPPKEPAAAKKRSPPKEPAAAKKNAPKQPVKMTKAERKAAQTTLFDYNTSINARSLLSKVSDMNEFVIRSTVLLDSDNSPINSKLSMYPKLDQKIKNHKSNYFRWSLKVKADGSYTIRFNRITAYRAKSLKDAIEKYVTMYARLSENIRAFNMYSTSHYDLSRNIIDKVLKKKSEVIVNM
jgi:outer membrane biosynthesis protein TonB